MLPTLADCASFALACGFDIVFAFILVHEYKGILVRFAGFLTYTPQGIPGSDAYNFKIARQNLKPSKIVKQQTTMVIEIIFIRRLNKLTAKNTRKIIYK
jgi:hypothetical protein